MDNALPGLEPTLGEETGLMVDLGPESDVLLIAFAGLAGRFGGTPSFEFLKSVSKFGVKKAFVRDSQKCWYHKGVEGVGPDIPAVADRLAGVVSQSDATRTVFIGNSAGGYAALLFGYLLDVDEVHAFQPQTILDPAIIDPEIIDLAIIDPDLGRLYKDDRYFDLLPVLDRGGVKTSFHIYYPPAELRKRRHALRLADIPGVVLHAVDAESGHVAKHLRDTGELNNILARALARDTVS